MRYALLLLLVPVLFALGCSRWIAQRGESLKIDTREVAIAKFGPPTAEGVEDGHRFEEFRSRRKYAELNRGNMHIMSIGFTFGLAELYYFPREVYLLAKRSLVGQTIRLTYQPNGEIHSIRIDGAYADVGWPKYDGVRPDTRPRQVPEPPPDVLTPTVQKLLETKK